VGDRVLENKLVYRFREPRRGEVIVFVAERAQIEDTRNFFRKVIDTLTEGLGVSAPADRDFIKRIVGLPGETVEMKDAVVTITRTDGTKLALSEPYLAGEKDTSPFGPQKVPPDTYFVMGDNRPNSADSRTRLGPIKRSDIVGKAFIKVWPIGRIGILSTPKYGEGPLGAGLVVVPLVVLGARRVRRRRLAGQPSRAA
jgi:signal peptidase I